MTARVLLAEDDLAMRQLLCARFGEAGIALEAVSDGEALIRRLEQVAHGAWLPEVVVSDLRMPGISGIDVLRWIQQHHAHIRVILITAFGDAHTHRRARALGALAVLDKPFDIADLLAIVGPLLDDEHETTRANGP